MKNILVIEPFYQGSHKYWLDKLTSLSQHNIKAVKKKGVWWKWRVQQSGFEYRLPKVHNFDIIVTTNMVNLATWAGMNRKNIGKAKLVHYFHENQLNYPGQTKEDIMVFGLIDVLSSFCADMIVFNSHYHRELFLKTIQSTSRKLREKLPEQDIKQLRGKAHVLPIGIEINKFLKHKFETVNKTPLLLWNHRWEKDKKPTLFLKTLMRLSREGYDFKLCMLGKAPREPLPIFAQAKKELKNHIVQWGAVSGFEDYARWLWKADLLPVTSDHDFFGISVLEAAVCNTSLLLPHKNAYPEHFDSQKLSHIYFHSDDEFYTKLKKWLESRADHTIPSVELEKYQWENIIAQYDEFFNQL
ncbi:MAG: hypothetical protein CME62_07840 [Halobacteriovoraceae bacterium]|nr:hypothetical protein [Halobacteriovoraceae bacterium]|tara:strand:- start:5446 stop:6513 length:1068 start_codon:yes stop_codon:yes gene_type:complete